MKRVFIEKIGGLVLASSLILGIKRLFQQAYKGRNMSTIHCHPDFLNLLKSDFGLKGEWYSFGQDLQHRHWYGYRCCKGRKYLEQFVEHLGELFKSYVPYMQQRFSDKIAFYIMPKDADEEDIGTISFDPALKIEEGTAKRKQDLRRPTRQNQLQMRLMQMNLEEYSVLLDHVQEVAKLFFKNEAKFEPVMTRKAVDLKIEEMQGKLKEYVYQGNGIKESIPPLRLLCLRQIFNKYREKKIKNWVFAVLSALQKYGYRSVSYPDTGDLAIYFGGKELCYGLMTSKGKIHSFWPGHEIVGTKHPLFSLPEAVGDKVLFVRFSRSYLREMQEER